MDLRRAFNIDADRYNTFRPHYSAALFNKLIKSAHITKDSILLEIGPGTGQATASLAKIGCKITAVELGAELANKARAELSSFANVKIITGAFEDVNLPPSHFDLIFSATAFHWIKDEFKFTKTAELLKPGGYLAIIHTQHVFDAADEFARASQPIYDKFWPRKQSPKTHQPKPPQIDGRLFELESFKAFPATFTYSAREYAGLLGTYSPVIALPPSKRKGFLAEIEALINARFDGSLKKKFEFTIAIAKRK